MDFNADEYYKNTYGVTVLNDDQIIKIIMKIDKLNASYVLTKPFHSSQKVAERCKIGSVIVSLQVRHNYEIERLILGFADSIEILKARKLTNRIKEKFQIALSNYDKEN